MARNEDYKKSSVKVINPYTFVPITPESINGKIKKELPSAEDYYKDKSQLHTGVLHCTLQVVTPLAIPDSEKKIGRDNEHKTYPFYKDREVYSIPGSSLRGVIRSVYETVTDSCFSTVKSNEALSLRTEANKPYNAGILVLEKDQKSGKYVYNLYKAKRMLLMIDGYTSVEDDGFEDVQRYPMDPEGDMRTIKVDSKDLKTGDKVWFKMTKDLKHKNKSGHLVWEDGIITDLKNSVNEKDKEKYSEGLVFLGEPIGKNKHGESIFAKVEGQIVESWNCSFDRYGNPKLDPHYEKLKETLDYYGKESINKNLWDKKKPNDSKKQHRGYPGFKNLDQKLAETGVPLWWYKESKEGPVYLSYAAIGRTMYDKTLNDLLGELNKCSDRSHLCEACLLFGMVGGSDQEKGMGSRIRIADAHAVGSPEMDEKVTLKELGTPRYSYMPFYSKYDSEHKSLKGVPASYDAMAIISGRKYYWNNKSAIDEDDSYRIKIGDEPNTVDQKSFQNERNVTVDLIKPGAKFKFDIYYDGIKEDQLKKLLWVITLGQNKLQDNVRKTEELLCHKLGRGKPLGLGSVKIVVDENVERIFDNETGIYRLDSREEKIEDMTGDSYEAVKKVASMNPFPSSPEIPIRYPDILDKNDNEIPLTEQQSNNKLARHQWYSKNKADIKKGEGHILPNIMDEDQSLFQYRYIGLNEKGKNRKSPISDYSSAQEGLEIYSAKIIEKIGPAKNQNFVEYQIQIDGDPRYRNANCIVSAWKGERLTKGQNISVTFFRKFGNKIVFNLKKE